MENNVDLSEEDLALIIAGRIVVADNATFYYNDNGQLHREDGPAIVWADGSTSWYQHNLLHRLDGPAVIFADGSKQWHHYGVMVWPVGAR